MTFPRGICLQAGLYREKVFYHLRRSLLFFYKLALQSCCHVFTASRSCSIMHLRDPIEILSSLLFHSPEQNEHSHSPFNSVMPDNIQFIYGELIKTRGGGLLVCALIYLNQQTVYCALM